MILQTSSTRNLKNRFFLLLLFSAWNVDLTYAMEESHAMESKEGGQNK